MSLVLYNSLTRRKEVFEPLDPQRVRMYVCGPTVYDEAHIGNARAITAFDLLYRVLRHEYGDGHVTYVRNITDVEDKIMAAAKASGQTIDQVTQRTTAVFHDDMAALLNLPPDIEPRATEYIPQMIALIERLIASGHAYAAEGHALFRVGSYAEYGKLSRRSRRDLIAGARIEVAPYKEDPGDFVLWKPSTPDQPGWDSPWGRGRPGWHIECSAMSENTLGPTFDIHGGGLDLIFPHHENEIAQSVCAHQGRGPADFARYWLHNGMLTVGGAKMAKSEGNFITVRQALGERPDWQRNGEILRLALLGTHYRDPLDWTEDRWRQENQRLFRFYTALNRGRQQMLNKGVRLIEPDPTLVPPEVQEALDDDLNSPLALSRLQELGHEINISRDQGKLDEVNRLQAALASGGQLMGLLNGEPQNWLRDAQASDPVLIDQLVADRVQARKDRNFAEADRIRTRLLDLGIVLEDHPDGTSTPRRK